MSVLWQIPFEKLNWLTYLHDCVIMKHLSICKAEWRLWEQMCIHVSLNLNLFQTEWLDKICVPWKKWQTKIIITKYNYKIFIFWLVDDGEFWVFDSTFFAEITLDVFRLLFTDFDTISVKPFLTFIAGTEMN